MRRLVINLDEDLDLWLAKQVNQNETVRNALFLYKDDISTPDTIHGLRKSYKQLLDYQKEKFEYYDQCFARLDKLISVLETRM
jgi:hypothetical protein